MDTGGIILNEITQVTQRKKDKPWNSLICCYLKQKTKNPNQKTNKLIEKEIRFVFMRGRKWNVEELDEGG